MIQDTVKQLIAKTHPYFTWDGGQADSLSGASDSLLYEQPITESFLQNSDVFISEIPNATDQHIWVPYILFFLLFCVALIWYFLSERLASIFIYPSNVGSKRQKEKVYVSPGFLISFFLFINYMVTFSLFIFLAIGYIFDESVDPYSDVPSILNISFIVFAFFLYQLVFIRTTGFLFNTKTISKQQQSIYVNVDNLMGIILIPLLILMIYTNVKQFVFVGIFIVLMIHLFRWHRTLILGKSISGFSVFHLFMYLCTLEIIPFLILIKLLKSGLI